MTDKLKPCPFCNGEAEMVESFLYGKVKGYLVSCKKCMCETRLYSSKQNAEKAWNRRADNEQSN